MPYVYIHGAIAKKDAAGVPIDDIGLLRGYGVFEVIRTFGKKPFLFGEHLARLAKSAAFMGMNVPAGEDTIKEMTYQLIEKNNIEGEAQIRIVLTGGPTEDGMTFDPKTSTFIISVSPLHKLPEQFYTEGIKLVTAEHERQTPRVKTLDYAKAVRLTGKVKEKGGFELLYTWEGTVREATTSNFFIVKDSIIVTPKNDILLGTTRNFVIGLIQKAGMPLEEREVTVDETLEADEAFITATNKDIVPVTRVDESVIGAGVPGGTTKQLMEIFHMHTKNA